MISLNLVSKELKQEIKLRHIYNFTKKINLAMIIITTVTAIILLTAKTILQMKFNSIVEQTTLVTRSNQGYNSKVREINGKINFVAKVQDEFIPWSNLLKTLSEIAPGDINLYYLKMSADNKSIKIKGKAGLRDSLLNFKQKMAATQIFKEIDFPIKNILEKENIDFEINARLNLSSL